MQNRKENDLDIKVRTLLQEEAAKVKNYKWEKFDYMVESVGGLSDHFEDYNKSFSDVCVYNDDKLRNVENGGNVDRVELPIERSSYPLTGLTRAEQILASSFISEFKYIPMTIIPKNIVTDNSWQGAELLVVANKEEARQKLRQNKSDDTAYVWKANKNGLHCLYGKANILLAKSSN